MDTVVNIPIGGMKISGSEKTVPDGASEDIINLRIKSGKWKPITYKQYFDTVSYAATISPTDSIYKHPITPDRHYIVWDSTSVRYVDNSSVLQTLLTLSGQEVWDVVSLDKSLIVTTNENKYFYTFSIDDTPNYTLLPEMPDIGDYLEWIEDSTTRRRDSVLDLTSYNAIYNAYLQLKTSARNDGLYSGHMLIRAGYRMFDGSVHKISEPFYVKVGQSSDFKWQMAYYIAFAVTRTYEIYYIDSNYPSYVFRGNGSLHFILAQYETIISEIVFYATVPTENYNVPAELTGTDNAWNAFPIVNTQDILKDQQDFYEVGSFKLSEYLEGAATDVYVKELPLPGIDVFPTKPSMPISLGEHEYLGKQSFVYNQRVHFGDLTKKFYEGYDPFYRGTVSSNALKAYTAVELPEVLSYNRTEVQYFTVYCLIKTEDREIVTKRLVDATVYSLLDGSEYVLLKSFPFYPNLGCYEIKVYVNDSSGPGGGQQHYLTLKLSDYNRYNYSAYQGWNDFNDTYTPSSTVPALSNKILFQLAVYLTYSSPDTPPTEQDTIHKPNTMMVSGLNNPLSYPFDQFYSFAFPETVIYAISAVVFEMSTAQFGQFPLYIFTDDGVYVLQQGQGLVLYVNINKASRVVIDDNVVIPIKTGLVFKTKDGLTLIQGKETILLSEALEGNNYGNVPVLNTAKNATDFLNYLDNAIFAYDFTENELWVTNNSYEYSYIFQANSGLWTKRKEKFDIMFIEAGTWVGLKANWLYDLSLESFSTVGMEFAIVTRPIKLSGANVFKKINTAICQMTGEITVTRNVSMKIYASNDTINWQLMRNSLQGPTELNDMTIKRLNGSAKYFIIVVEGYMQNIPSEISGFVVEFKKKYTNKIR